MASGVVLMLVSGQTVLVEQGTGFGSGLKEEQETSRQPDTHGIPRFA